MTAHASPDTSPLLRSDRGAVAILALNRPEQRNALSEALIAALTGELARIGRDRAVRAVVIAGPGPVFSSGHDLKEFRARRGDADHGRAYYADMMQRCAGMMQAIVALPQPVIAAIEGLATAAGCQLVASCDLAVAGDAARFATPGVQIGLFCSTPMVALSRNVARKDAMEMLLLGEPVAAEEARRIGLVNRVVPQGGAEAEALRMAEAIAAKSSRAIGIGKNLFYRQAEMPLAEAYRQAAEAMVENMLAADAEEGIGAFLDKRAPVWTGR